MEQLKVIIENIGENSLKFVLKEKRAQFFLTIKGSNNINELEIDLKNKTKVLEVFACPNDFGLFKINKLILKNIPDDAKISLLFNKNPERIVKVENIVFESSFFAFNYFWNNFYNILDVNTKMFIKIKDINPDKLLDLVEKALKRKLTSEHKILIEDSLYNEIFEEIVYNWNINKKVFKNYKEAMDAENFKVPIEKVCCFNLLRLTHRHKVKIRYDR